MPKKKEREEPVEQPPKRRYFQGGLMVYGLAVAVIGAISLLGYYGVDRRVVDALLIISGLWLFKKAVASGFSKKRRELFKKYI